MEITIDYTFFFDLWNFFVGKYCSYCGTQMIEYDYHGKTMCPYRCVWKDYERRNSL
jgi:hypothetical protein